MLFRSLTMTDSSDDTKVRKWEIYFSPQQGGFTLDRQPEGFYPEAAYIDSIRTGQSLSELLTELDSPSLLMLDDVIEAYSRHYLDIP